ncbi:AraC family transcriptional regulator [Dyella sp. C11]|uniref:AraC family transcriptional regulator n=1 Tax=Dyella sp. C11 TaxID=2126991 RepID=UPI0018E4FBBC|nr:AraC family transcriptional regulator [Dyella sp. C11]
MRNRSSMIDDPLSDVLKLAEVHSVVAGGFYASGPWAVRFPAPDKVKFFAAAKGSCWLRFDGDEPPLRFQEGDVILLASARSFTLSSDPQVQAVASRGLFAGRTEAFVAIGNSSATAYEVMQVGGHFSPHPAYSPLLMDVLPPFIHVQGASPEARALQWILQQLVQEREGLPGAALATSQLGLLLFVQALRAHLASGAMLKASWLRAVTDPRLAPVMRLMHADPARAWRLDELAQRAAMSRTAFATHFKATAGDAPLAYLARWRMRLAEHALRHGDTPVSALAQTLGYASESAFSHAFKRIVGRSPRHYAAGFRGDLVNESDTEVSA